MNQQQTKSEILAQIKAYLDGTITKEKYAYDAEEFYWEYAQNIEGSEFSRRYTDLVIDACLYYVDGPKLTPEIKEAGFRKAMINAYDILSEL